MIKHIGRKRSASAFPAPRFRLLRFAKGLNQIFVALILTIPKLCNVGVILIILLGLFSVMGMHVFGKTHALGPHDAHANFRTLMRSVLTLFRSAGVCLV